jgi:hypothetical protein
LKFEQFEQRLLMSADGIGIDLVNVEQFVEEVAPLVADVQASNSSNASENQYGFDGSGQTIAVIDSGIAWDHVALGGGYGDGNKVVGGWDFAENDANPYDDGPAGFHGTHVAGIAAGDGGGYEGVASGADLVSLRVFNDQGIGKIEWVESALQWVRNNLDSFRNPITTVNMSLGADWATETSEDWSVISDELQSLKAEGVFISVAAGNDFEDFGNKTLSYPADSEHVVAVASHDANNQLSEFSQRDDGVLVAPGENIQSSVPNHLFGNRKVDQLLGASGTSMAAPYVAGASAVLREAYAAMGYGEVDQDTLYDTFLKTSNSIYDSITQTTFRQLDLNAAIASITESVAHNQGLQDVGTLTGGETLRGSLASSDDTNGFRFAAPANGQVELSFEATEQLSPMLEVKNQSGNVVELSFEANRVYFDVVAGESYQLEVSSNVGTGHYQVMTAFQQTALSTNLGTVDSIEVDDFIAGDRTYSLTASNSGPLAFGFSTGSTEGTIEVYDAMMNRLTTQSTQEGRVDFQFDVVKGESLFVLLKADGNVNLSVDNLVSLDHGTLTVNGTDKADSFVISDNETLDIEVNGTLYSLKKTDVTSIFIQGESSQDSLKLNLGDRFERTVLRQNRVDAFDGSSTLRAIGFQRIDVQGSGTLTVAGSEGNDSISGNYSGLTIASGSSRATGTGFTTLIADGKDGDDVIHFEGSDQNDILFSKDNYSAIRSGDSRLIAINYEQLSVDGAGGYDFTNLFGADAKDEFTLGTDLIKVANDQTTLSATGFERGTAFARDTSDAVVFVDSEGDDRFLFADGTTQLVSEHAHLVAHQFTTVTANSTQGYDVAQISGTTGNEQLSASLEQSIFENRETTIEVNHFNRVNVVANFQGQDSVQLTGSAGNDQLYVDSGSASAVFSNGSIVRTVGFGDVSFDGNGGFDSSFLEGSQGADVLAADNEQTTLLSGNIKTVVREVEATHYEGNGGGDNLYIDDVSTLDVVATLGDKAFAVLERHQIEAEGFELLEATAVDGVIATYDMERVDFSSVLRGQWKSR